MKLGKREVGERVRDAQTHISVLCHMPLENLQNESDDKADLPLARKVA